MAYPRVVIDLGKIKTNVDYLLNKSKGLNIDLMGITKVFSGSFEIAKLYQECGIKYLGDSRIENLKLYKDIDIPKVMIRLPMKSQVEEVVKYCDISMNSELSTVEALNEEAKKQEKIHKIILMVELGDLREGILPKNIKFYMDRIIKLENIKLEGLAVNLTCYGGVIPSPTNLGELEKIANLIEADYNLKLNIISGGNSSSIELLLSNQLPKKINNLRLGESLAFGREAAYGNHIDGCYGDAISLEAEIIELKEKDSVPTGEIGMNAFGEKPEFKDVGKMVRAIVAIGRQDVDQDNLLPKDDRLEIIGASSDHLIVDITIAKDDYKVGDKIKFLLGYSGLLQLSTSNYVTKLYKW
jgi:predicted amino acid racemase